MMWLPRQVPHFFSQIISSAFRPYIIRALQGLFLLRGHSEKTEHLKVIENKVSNPSQMHDIQSVGHTWLLSDKTLQVQTVARALLRQWGTRRHFRCLSDPFSAPQYWVSF